jgi:4-diphosphocytidyl-2-C-methyl-D-erythritol kinase
MSRSGDSHRRRALIAGVDWPAPAKLNLFLHVVGRRADGYHLLQTAFQFLDRCDGLRVAARDDGRLRLHGVTPGVAEADNLVLRAAAALQRASGTRLGADLHLDKRLPLGGGLGGGSSDAATTLVVLDRLWETRLGEDALAAIGLGLGADVPVFVRGRAAWAEGVGEALTPIALPEPWFTVLCPACEVSTAAVFGDPELTRDTAPTTIHAFSIGAGRNDCEPLVRRRYPMVAVALDLLAVHGASRLTGTGGCVFAAFSDRSAAEHARDEAAKAGLDGFVAKGRNRSPLHEALARLR